MPLYEIALLQKPTKKEVEDGVLEKLLLGPKCIIARDDQTAGMLAVRQLPDDVDISRVEVLTRPFA